MAHSCWKRQFKGIYTKIAVKKFDDSFILIFLKIFLNMLPKSAIMNFYKEIGHIFFCIYVAIN